MLNAMFKSVLEQDRAAVVICDLSHTIVYMNPAAVEEYKKRGGAALLGQNLMDCHNPHSQDCILKVLNWFSADPQNNLVFTSREEDKNRDVYMVALRDEEGDLIGYYEKHEYRDAETMPFYDIK